MLDVVQRTFEAGEEVLRPGHTRVRMRFDQNNRVVVTDNSGAETKINEQGKAETRDPNKPDAQPIMTWDFDKKTMETKEMVITPEETKFTNGDTVKHNGEVVLRNGDRIDQNGNFYGHDGTLIDADGNVQTSDGWSCSDAFSGHPEAKGLEGTASSVQSNADAVAAAVMQKVSTGSVDFSDVGKLQAALGDIAGLLPVLMAAGNFDAVAKLMAAQGRVEGTLNMAIPRAQAAEIAHRMGISSPMLIAEMQNNIYGKTPEQTVKSVVDGHHIKSQAN